MKKIFKCLITIVILSNIIISIEPVVVNAASNTSSGVILNVTQVIVRKKTKKEAEALAYMNPGEKITIYNDYASKEWYKVSCINRCSKEKVTGYIYKSCALKGRSSLKTGVNYILIVRSQFKAYYINSNGNVKLYNWCGVGKKADMLQVTNKAGVNLRKSASIKSSKMCLIPYGVKRLKVEGYKDRMVQGNI